MRRKRKRKRKKSHPAYINTSPMLLVREHRLATELRDHVETLAEMDPYPEAKVYALIAAASALSPSRATDPERA